MAPIERVQFDPDTETTGTLYQTTAAASLGVVMGGVYGAVASAFTKGVAGTKPSIAMAATATSLLKHSGLFALGFGVYGGYVPSPRANTPRALAPPPATGTSRPGRIQCMAPT